MMLNEMIISLPISHPSSPPATAAQVETFIYWISADPPSLTSWISSAQFQASQALLLVLIITEGREAERGEKDTSHHSTRHTEASVNKILSKKNVSISGHVQDQ